MHTVKALRGSRSTNKIKTSLRRGRPATHRWLPLFVVENPCAPSPFREKRRPYIKSGCSSPTACTTIKPHSSRSASLVCRRSYPKTKNYSSETTSGSSPPFCCQQTRSSYERTTLYVLPDAHERPLHEAILNAGRKSIRSLRYHPRRRIIKSTTGSLQAHSRGTRGAAATSQLLALPGWRLLYVRLPTLPPSISQIGALQRYLSRPIITTQ